MELSISVQSWHLGLLQGRFPPGVMLRNGFVLLTMDLRLRGCLRAIVGGGGVGGKFVLRQGHSEGYSRTTSFLVRGGPHQGDG